MSVTITVTPAQARNVAQFLAEARRLHAAADGALALLTLGHDLPDGATVADINVDTGVLTFHVEQPVSPTEGT